MAGKGTRLRPHTHTTPKPLLELAGKPMLAHVLDRVKELKPKEAVFIVDEGNDTTKLKKYLEKNYGFKAHFMVQKERKGVGHAIHEANELFSNEEVLILFADTLIEANLKDFRKKNPDGIIWTKEVEDPRQFGVVFLHEGYISKLVEKPEIPHSNEAIVGMYYFKNSDHIFGALKYIIDNDIKGKGEYQLTDAIQIMIDRGALLESQPINMWKDCGNVESLLEANRYLLKNINLKTKPEKSVIIKPVSIAPGAEIKNSIIGPNVSIGRDSIIENSVVKESILGKETEVKEMVLKESMLGNNTKIKSNSKKINIGDNSESEY